MIVDNGRYYVYRHIRLDTGYPFYIGLGSKLGDNRIKGHRTEYSRAYSKINRGPIWKIIYNKNNNYQVEILLESDNYQFTKDKEVELIKLYGRIDRGTGCLANMTDGGDGSINCIRTEEWNQKIAKSTVGNKRNVGRVHTEEARKHYSESAKKRGMSEECRKGHKKAAEEGKLGRPKGIVPSEEHRGKISATLKGRKLSEECLRKRSLTTKGRVSPRKGKKYPKVNNIVNIKVK